MLVLSCSCLWPIHWSQVLSRVWRCSWSSADRRCSNYIWVISNFIAYTGASYIRGLTVNYCSPVTFNWGGGDWGEGGWWWWFWQGMPKILICKSYLKIALLRIRPHPFKVNKLNCYLSTGKFYLIGSVKCVCFIEPWFLPAYTGLGTIMQNNCFLKLCFQDNPNKYLSPFKNYELVLSNW